MLLSPQFIYSFIFTFLFLLLHIRIAVSTFCNSYQGQDPDRIVDAQYLPQFYQKTQYSFTTKWHISLNTPNRYTLKVYHHHHHHHYLSPDREGRLGTTDDFATSFLHFPLFSTALWDLPNSSPVYSLMLSSHLFPCLPCLLFPFTVPCKIVLPDLMNGRYDHTTAGCVSLLSSGGLRVVHLPNGSWHGLPRWYYGLFMRCVVSCGSTSFPWLLFFFGPLL